MREPTRIPRALAPLLCGLALLLAVPLELGAQESQRPAPAEPEHRCAEQRLDELERRVAELAESLGRVSRALQAHVRESAEPEPTPEPRPRPRPRPVPGPQPPPDVVGWPSVPSVTVALDPRGRAPIASLALAPGAWTVEPDGWRWSLSTGELAGLAVLCWRQQHPGWEATMTTVAVVNGWPGAGTIHLERMRVAVEGAAPIVRDEHDAIDPRRPLLWRFYSGEHAEDLRAWRHVDPGPTAPWIPGLCEQGRAELEASLLELGPYRIASPKVRGSSSLNGSHGGWSISPWWGGADGWQATCREGLAWMGAEWMAQAMRSPIVLLEPGGFAWWNPVRAAREARAAAQAAGVPAAELPPAPGYWPGATVQHEPPGYEVAIVPTDGSSWSFRPLDGWCAYESTLREYRPHDHTHYRRLYAAASAVAEHDVAARWWLRQSWGQLAAWLDGAPSSVNLLAWLPQMLDGPAGVGDSRGGRGWGQTLRCYLDAEPYLAAEPALAAPSWGGTWRSALVALTARWAMPGNGWTHRTGKEGFPTPGGGWGALAAAPTIAAPRELFLVAANYGELGLEALLERARSSLRPLPGDGGAWIGTGEHVASSPTVKHWADGGAWRAPNAQTMYEAHVGLFQRWGGLAGVLAAAEAEAKSSSRSPREHLLDNLPASTWRAALR